MQNAEMRIKLGNMIRRAARAAKVRQIRLAETLGISAAAVSQMLSGKMAPSLQQLEVILRLLRVDRLTAAEIRNCLTGVRVGGKAVRSPLNQTLRAARKQCGLSVEALAEKTGIAPAELRAMENRVGMVPNAAEAARLAAVLGRKPADFRQQETPEWHVRSFEVPSSMLFLADGGSREELALYQMPLMELFMLNYFEPGEMDAAAFLKIYGTGTMLESSEPGMLAVTINGSEVGLSGKRTVRLVAAPLAAVADGDLLIGRDPTGKVRIGMLNGERILPWMPAGGTEENQSSWQWYWPIRLLNVEQPTKPDMILK